MKKPFRMLLLISVFFAGINLIKAQAPPPPSGGHGSRSNQPAGGSAPIGSGTLLLLGMGAAYGAYKYKTTRQE